MVKTLLLEDEPVLREEIADFLQSAGHAVTPVASLAAFHAAFVPNEHRIAIIDLMLPDGDGQDLIAQLRQSGHRLGIIVLTARASTHDKVTGLNQGADYYISKTADLQELLASFQALIRRLDLQETPRWVLKSASRQLIPPGHAPIALSAQDYLVLYALAVGIDADALQRPVSRATIIQALGREVFDYDQRRLDTQIYRLRRKVEQACPLRLPITTTRGVGFHFYEPIDVID